MWTYLLNTRIVKEFPTIPVITKTGGTYFQRFLSKICKSKTLFEKLENESPDNESYVSVEFRLKSLVSVVCRNCKDNINTVEPILVHIFVALSLLYTIE